MIMIHPFPLAITGKQLIQLERPLSPCSFLAAIICLSKQIKPTKRDNRFSTYASTIVILKKNFPFKKLRPVLKHRSGARQIILLLYQIFVEKYILC